MKKGMFFTIGVVLIMTNTINAQDSARRTVTHNTAVFAAVQAKKDNPVKLKGNNAMVKQSASGLKHVQIDLLANYPTANNKQGCRYNLNRISGTFLTADDNSGIGKIECGLDGGDGWSIGLGGSACLSLDFAGLQSAPDTAIATQNNTYTGVIDADVSVGVVFKIP